MVLRGGKGSIGLATMRDVPVGQLLSVAFGDSVSLEHRVWVWDSCYVKFYWGRRLSGSVQCRFFGSVAFCF